MAQSEETKLDKRFDQNIEITGTLRITSTADASASSTGHGFQVGTTDSLNMIMDNNELMARNNGSVSGLNFNPDGGAVTIHNNTTAGTFTIGGNDVIHTGNISDHALTSLPSHEHTYTRNVASLSAADDAMPSLGYSLQHFLGYGPSGNDGHILGMTWTGSSAYGAQIYIDTDPNNIMAFRSRSSTGSWTAWNNLIHSGNISSQSVSYATTSGHSSTSDNAGTVDGIDSSRIIYGSNTSGTNESNYSDWNALTKTGFYSHSGASNRWSSADNWSSVLHFKLYDNNNLYASQLGFNTYDNRIYARTNSDGNWTAWDEFITTANISSQSVSYATSAGSASSATNSTNATNLGSYYTADDWFRATSDDNHVKFYGNTRQMVFRTDGATEFASGVGGYAFAWMYGGNSSGSRRMLLATDGRLWTNYHGWMDEAFLGKTAKAADSELLDGLNSTGYMRDDGWNTNPGQDANAQSTMKSDFTYANNAPHTGDLIRFGASGYSLQLNAAYQNSENFSFRTYNNDSAKAWNPWRTIYHSGNANGSGTNWNANVSYANIFNIYNGPYLSDYNSRNLRVTGTSSSDVGISGIASGGQFGFQVYGNGSGDYGFLTSEWGAWDLQKSVSGNLYMNNSTSYYLNTTGTSYLNALSVNSQISGSVSGTSNAVAITGYGNGNFTFYQSPSAFDAFSGWHNYFIGNHGDGSNYYHTTIAMPFWGPPRYSRREGGTLRGPYEFWTSERDINSSANITAPAYYDYNNTACYIDPDSTNSGSLRGNLFFNDYGAGVVGTYSSYRYQGVFSMGDSYKLPIDGTNTGSLYGLAWSHPNAGGVASNLNTHGLIACENGTWMASLCSSTRAATDMRAPIFYDLNDTTYYTNPQGLSNMGKIKFNDTVAQGTPGGDATIGRNYAYNTLELKGYGSELMIGAQSTGIHINYRYCNGVGSNAYTPQIWYWRAGTSSNWSDHHFGNVYAGTYYDRNDTSKYLTRYTGNYGAWRMGGSQGGYSGLEVDGGMNLMIHTNGASGPCGFWAGNWSILTYVNSNQFLYYDGNEKFKTLSDGAQVTGTLYVTGDVIAYYSDIRLKQDIENIDNAVDKIKKLRGVTYTWNNKEVNVVKERAGTRDIGLIAQEVEEVEPLLVTEYQTQLNTPSNDPEEASEFVPEFSESYKTIKYDKIVALLIEATKEQQDTIDKLSKEIKELKKLINP